MLSSIFHEVGLKQYCIQKIFHLKKLRLSSIFKTFGCLPFLKILRSFSIFHQLTWMPGSALTFFLVGWVGGGDGFHSIMRLKLGFDNLLICHSQLWLKWAVFENGLTYSGCWVGWKIWWVVWWWWWWLGVRWSQLFSFPELVQIEDIVDWSLASNCKQMIFSHVFTLILSNIFFKFW